MTVGPASDRNELARSYEKPFGWWGLERDEAEPRSLPWLIQSGLLAVGSAALLALAVEMRRTIIVVAEETGAGKTTLLTALLDFVDPLTRPVYVRGLYERFDYITELDPANRYVLCNEISSYLPTYLWGRGVRRLFEGAAAGFPLATTMHASSAAHAIELLRGYPLDVNPSDIAGVDLIVTMKLGMIDGRQARRVTAIDRVRFRDGEARLQRLAERNPLRSELELSQGRMVAAIAEWGEIDERVASRLLASQERFLAICGDADITEPAAFRERLAGFRSNP